MSFQAVIFDMDGLLMDSERVGLDVMHECGLLQDYNIPVEMVRETIGSNKQSSSDYYHRFFPDLDTDRLFLDFKDAMCDLAKRGKIPLKKGARELLEEIKRQNIPMAVASSSGQATIGIYLDSVGVIAYFDALITGNGLPSKPAPDIFLKAAAALNAEPEKCMVLEDSINGIKAGRAAGMTVGMVPDVFPYTEDLAPYVDHVLPDLSAAIPLFVL
ncbi:MAG: HAD family phosphatase [Clostridia bacterium]|nr:HAD family phosphatase [Clostridia bacterium]